MAGQRMHAILLFRVLFAGLCHTSSPMPITDLLCLVLDVDVDVYRTVPDRIVG